MINNFFKSQNKEYNEIINSTDEQWKSMNLYILNGKTFFKLIFIVSITNKNLDKDPSGNSL